MTNTPCRFRTAGLPIALAAAAALVLAACSEPQQAPQQAPPPVHWISVEAQNISIESEYAGRIRGSREVEVRARVEGILLERLYDEGQVVDQGDELFLIDPEPYEIAVRQAAAELATARAGRNQAEREWNRVSGLYQHSAVSERDRDQAQSALELAEAGVALAEAGMSSAELNLQWTRVTAAISGVTGLETVSEGSLIDNGALLTTITQTDPVHVRFSLPERDAVIQRRARRAMTGNAEQAQQPVELILPDGSNYGREGSIDFTDATIDARTGSVSARAVFPNPDGDVVPGQFVRVRMTTRHLEAVFLVPREAIAQGSEGAQVFVLGDGDQVSARTVRLGPTVGADQVILDGLEGGERIVVSGLNNLRDGMSVEPHPDDGA